MTAKAELVPGVTAPVAGDRDALERSALAKTMRQLVPILALGYFFNYVDRTSVGFAGLTMNRDLGLTATQFGWGPASSSPAIACWKYPAR